LAYLKGEVAAENPPYESMLRWLDLARKSNAIDDDVTLLRFLTKR
jgi:hypothetical protein